MTDPSGSSQPGWGQAAWNQGDPSYGAPAQDPNTPYPSTAQYPSSSPYAAPQYPGQQYPGQQYPAQQYGQGYPGQQYPGTDPYASQYGAAAPTGIQPQGYGAQNFYGSPPPGYGAPPPKQGSGRIWIIIAAVVAALAVIAAVVVVVVVNQTPGPDSVVAEGTSTPGLAIPDDSPTGASNVIRLGGGSALVGRIVVGLEFQHRLPREITATLRAPNGREAVIFPRTEIPGPTVDLTLDSATAGSPLGGLIGAPVAGDWTLTMTDSVAIDTATLTRWSVTAYPAAAGVTAPPETTGPLTGSSSPYAAIPEDSSAGITDRITLNGQTTVQRISVDVRMTHTYSRDLTVVLTSPSGQRVTLLERADNMNPVVVALDSSTPGSPLSAFVGQPAGGVWQLLVTDTVARDTGTLDTWEITVNG